MAVEKSISLTVDDGENVISIDYYDNQPLRIGDVQVSEEDIIDIQAFLAAYLNGDLAE